MEGQISKKHEDHKAVCNQLCKKYHFYRHKRKDISNGKSVCFSEGLVKPYILAIDSTLLKADKGHVWHVSSMKEGLLPHSGIDTDARWGFSHTPEAGYLDTNFIWYVALILLLLSPILTADITTANIPDNQIYPGLTSSSSFTLSSETIKKIHFMVEDPGYDDQSLYDLSMSMGFRLYVYYADTKTHQKKDSNWLISISHR